MSHTYIHTQYVLNRRERERECALCNTERTRGREKGSKHIERGRERERVCGEGVMAMRPDARHPPGKYEEEDEGITRAVKSLDDVLTRLAMAKDENLPRIAPRLLPSLLEQLSSKHAAVRNKAMQVLSHLNVRIRDDERVLLPTAQLLALLVRYAPKTSTDSGATTTATLTVTSSLVASTALVYVTKAAERCSDEELISCCGKLLEACTVVQISHDAPAGSIGGELRRLLALSVAKLGKDMAWKRKRPRSLAIGSESKLQDCDTGSARCLTEVCCQALGSLRLKLCFCT